METSLFKSKWYFWLLGLDMDAGGLAALRVVQGRRPFARYLSEGLNGQKPSAL